MAFKHGITVTEIVEGARTLTAVSTSIIGLVATASDARAAVFPLDRPALITDVETAIGSAGVQGTLAKALRAIADLTRPIVVVVRVADGHSWQRQKRDGQEGVWASWHDRKAAKKHTVTEGKADGAKQLRKVYPDEASAKRAAKAEQRRLQPAPATFDIKLALGRGRRLPGGARCGRRVQA